jgi:hypothetical protein
MLRRPCRVGERGRPPCRPPGDHPTSAPGRHPCRAGVQDRPPCRSRKGPASLPVPYGTTRRLRPGGIRAELRCCSLAGEA